jgi:hypothetical protein
VTFVIRRGEGTRATGPSGRLGTYRAVDGSAGAPVHLDFDGPYATLIVGKRGYGKSYTVGVFDTLAEPADCEPVSATVVEDPAVVVDDTTETVHAVTVRRRTTPHGGDSPSASDVLTE